jgi:hypothetical protein
MSKKPLPPAVRRFVAGLDRLAALAMVSVLLTGSGFLLAGTVTAQQITSRSLAMNNAQAGQTANYTFTFTPAGTSAIQSMKFTACTTPLGSCTAPTGINISAGTINTGSSFQGTQAFTKDSTTTGCTAASILCIKRVSADTTSQTLTAHTVSDSGVTNQDNTNCSSAANCTFFIRIITYSDIAFTTAVDNGTVAGSTTQLFTVNATIQEALTFCIGATTINDATTAPPACSSVSGTSLNLGTLQPSDISISPVASTGSGKGDDNNAIAELSTNAGNGTQIAYDAVQQSGTNHRGTLRVAGATCQSGTVNTDQCLNPVGTTQSTLTAGTENFGMTIAAVNCAATVAYTCSFAGGTYNLSRDTNYDGTGANTYPTDTDLIGGPTQAAYAWDDSGAMQTVASSSTVVDREALIIKFAATPNFTTPTGSYTALVDFIATPTY